MNKKKIGSGLTVNKKYFLPLEAINAVSFRGFHHKKESYSLCSIYFFSYQTSTFTIIFNFVGRNLLLKNTVDII
jgi:hypothetical protein